MKVSQLAMIIDVLHKALSSSILPMQRRESLTNQILSCARTTGRSQSLPFLVEDAQVLYRKLSTVAIDRGLETVAPATKISSSMCVRVCVLNLLSGLQ